MASVSAIGPDRWNSACFRNVSNGKYTNGNTAAGSSSARYSTAWPGSRTRFIRISPIRHSSDTAYFAVSWKV